MPARYHIEPDRRLIITVLEGVLSDRDLLQTEVVRADPAFDPAYDQLVDARKVTAIEATSAAVRQLALTDPFGPGSRRAIVVSSDAAFGVARMFQNLVDGGGEQMVVVRDMNEAARWLALD